MRAAEKNPSEFSCSKQGNRGVGDRQTTVLLDSVKLSPSGKRSTESCFCLRRGKPEKEEGREK